MGWNKPPEGWSDPRRDADWYSPKDLKDIKQRLDWNNKSRIDNSTPAPYSWRDEEVRMLLAEICRLNRLTRKK